MLFILFDFCSLNSPLLFKEKEVRQFNRAIDFNRFKSLAFYYCVLLLITLYICICKFMLMLFKNFHSIIKTMEIFILYRYDTKCICII